MRRLIDLLNCYHLIIQRAEGAEKEVVTALTAIKSCGQVQLCSRAGNDVEKVFH